MSFDSTKMNLIKSYDRYTYSSCNNVNGYLLVESINLHFSYTAFSQLIYITCDTGLGFIVMSASNTKCLTLPELIPPCNFSSFLVLFDQNPR